MCSIFQEKEQASESISRIVFLAKNWEFLQRCEYHQTVKEKCVEEILKTGNNSSLERKLSLNIKYLHSFLSYNGKNKKRKTCIIEDACKNPNAKKLLLKKLKIVNSYADIPILIQVK